MTILFKRLQEILDLDNFLEEANKKLRNTYMIVNGSLVYINIFNTEDNKITVTTQNNKKVVLDVKTIEPWTPESGLYPLSTGNALLLIKIPYRKWEKSFVIDNYKFMVVGQRENLSLNYLDEASKSKVVEIFVDSGGYIWYLDTLIGYVKDENTIVCTNEIFTQELKDWCNDKY